jgi:drug/metabolite transporter (DMT)-like permease
MLPSKHQTVVDPDLVEVRLRLESSATLAIVAALFAGFSLGCFSSVGKSAYEAMDPALGNAFIICSLITVLCSTIAATIFSTELYYSKRIAGGMRGKEGKSPGRSGIEFLKATKQSRHAAVGCFVLSVPGFISQLLLLGLINIPTRIGRALNIVICSIGFAVVVFAFFNQAMHYLTYESQNALQATKKNDRTTV